MLIEGSESFRAYCDHYEDESSGRVFDMFTDRTQSPWPFCNRYIDEMSEQETDKLSKTLGIDRATEFANMILLYNLNLDIKQLKMRGRDIQERHDKVRTLYLEEKKKFSNARYSLLALLGEEAYHRAPVIEKTEFFETFSSFPKRTPLWNLRKASPDYQQVKSFLKERSIVRVDNGDGKEFVLLAVHDQYRDFVAVIHPSLSKRKFKIRCLRDYPNSQHTLGFANAINIMLLVRNQLRSGLFCNSDIAFIGLKGSGEVPDEVDYIRVKQPHHCIPLWQTTHGMACASRNIRRSCDKQRKLKIDRKKWHFRESRNFGKNAEVDELSDEELGLFANLDRANGMKQFIELYNRYKMAKYRDSIYCRKKDKYEQAKKEYPEEKKKYSEIVFSLPSLIGKEVYEKAPIVTEEAFCEKVGDDPKRTPLGMLRYVKVKKLRALFSSEKPIVRVDNGDGIELVLISAHYFTDQDVIFVAHKSLKKKKLELWRMDAALYYLDKQYKEPLWFGKALNIKLLVQNGMRSGIMYRNKMVYLGLSEKKPSDEADRESG